MFHKIIVEKNLRELPRVKKILGNPIIRQRPVKEIKKWSDFFGPVKKPYLHKRTTLNLIIASNQGTLIKIAPQAYGEKKGKHYYFVHAYNCIFECEYCFLQGYFTSPDIVLFINYEDIGKEILKLIRDPENNNKTLYFHGGEFSDSLALSHLAEDIPYYFQFFKNIPQHYLELRTKSANIKILLEQNPLANIITSFSLAPAGQTQLFEHFTSSLKSRLWAINKLYLKGFPISIHLDPIIYTKNIFDEYDQFLDLLLNHIPAQAIVYISLGVVRFTKTVYRQFQQNYPQSPILAGPLEKSPDQKMRYPGHLRFKILNGIKKCLLNKGIEEKKIYLCMEE